MEGLTRLGQLIFVLAITVGPLFVSLLLLNLRDRRADQVLAAVVPHLASRDLDGRVTAQVRCGVLSPQCVLSVSFWALSGEEFWAFGTKLARNIPSHVQLVLEGTIGVRVPTTIRAEPVLTRMSPGPPAFPSRLTRSS